MVLTATDALCPDKGELIRNKNLIKLQQQLQAFRPACKDKLLSIKQPREALCSTRTEKPETSIRVLVPRMQRGQGCAVVSKTEMRYIPLATVTVFRIRQLLQHHDQHAALGQAHLSDNEV